MEQIKFELEDLITSDRKSIQYFSNLRWNGKRLCPRCKCEEQYYIESNRYSCKKCRYKFHEFTGTYLGELKIKPSLRTYLVHLFVEEQSAYTSRHYVKCDISTIERVFRLFRHAIYDKSIEQIHKKLNIFRGLGIDERILDTHRREDHYLEYKKNIDGKDYLFFAIYLINKFVVTFPVSDIKDKEKIFYLLTTQINEKKEFPYYPNNYGAFYQYDNSIAYAMLDIKKRNVVSSNDIESGEGENMYIGLEGFWNYIKKWLYHYRGVRLKYFHLDLKEIEFRFNNYMNNHMFNELTKLLVEPLPNL